jgi:GT2 family glycosyltransferase
MTAAEARLPGHWLSEEAQVEFFDAVLQRALRAEHSSGALSHCLDLAGTLVELVFAGDRLARRFMPALAHLGVAPERSPDIRFHVWDSASTGVAMIPPPCKHDCFTDRGDIWGMASERIKSAFHWSEYSVNLMDLERRRAVFWVRAEAELPYWTTAAPLRTLFHWWMEQNGGQLLHAAAVGTEDAALLITGKGGVGKSSVALSCLEAGMRYVADDYLVVRLDPEPRVFSLYSTAKLDPEQTRQFPWLSPFVANEGSGADEKAVLRLFPEFTEQIARSLPLKAIATPRFVPRPGTSFAATEAVRLERAAAFTTMSQLPHAGRTTHRFIKRLVAELPGLELRLGHELQRIPGAIRELLRQPSDELWRTSRGGVTQGFLASRPLISVIIPVYNGARFLEEAIGNILGQNYDALEMIVIDDGSTDDIAAVLGRLPVDVRYFRQDNAGAAGARNRGIKDASGDLIAFLDVDDLWPDENLNILSSCLAGDPALDLVHGRGQLTRYSGGAGIGEYFGNPGESFPCYIGAGLYRRQAFEKVGLFDPELRFGEDTDWFNRAVECGLRMARLDEVTLFVRRHDANMTRGKSLVERNMIRVLKKQLDRRANSGER